VLEFCRLLHERKLYIMWNCQSRVDTLDEEMVVEMKRAGWSTYSARRGVGLGAVFLAMYDKRTTVADIERASAGRCGAPGPISPFTLWRAWRTSAPRH
jgi:hypothetical protein